MRRWGLSSAPLHAPPLEPSKCLVDRFDVLGTLGVGAHGVVLEARDQRSGRKVAVKVLAGLQPEALYRFKREFRALTHVSHPNLVNLHELYLTDENEFFTMDLVEGTDFVNWVRPAGTLDEARLREVLPQLVAGLAALHGEGIIHRDLKPSNVMVQRDGRLRIADFGLAAPLESDEDADQIVGSPLYMSPEQAAAADVGPSSDWYGVGVMLYEALVGRPPLDALDGLALLMAKQAGRFPAPAALDPSVPADLNTLCLSLLSTDPGARPGARDLLSRLGVQQAEVSTEQVRAGGVVVGRESELDRLSQAWQQRTGGGPVVAAVHGRSGTGKTALLRAFGARAAREGALVLAAAAYERESVPYGGVDELVDRISRHLDRLPPDELEALLPDNPSALSLLFPVLDDIVGFAEDSVLPPQDPVELRRMAFDQLRQLVRSLAGRWPLLLILDDVQWCGSDTFDLLASVLRPPNAPDLMLLVSYREQHDASTAGVDAFLEVIRRRRSVTPVVDLTIDDLAPEAAAELARTLVAGRGTRDVDLAQRVARESGGNPLFLQELARYVQSDATPDPGVLRLETMVADRLHRLSDEAVVLAEVLAVCGGPTPVEVVLRAAGGSESVVEALSLLRARHFVRGRVSDPDVLDLYHDRVRAAVVGGMAPDRVTAIHRQLAPLTIDDPERAAYHHEGAGDTLAAAACVVQAAELAERALAFDRAARLYRRAIDLAPDDARVGERWGALADACANAGRGSDAAAAYMEAAGRAKPEDRPELRRRAADQLLRSGRVDEGMALLRDVMAQAGMSMPGSPRTAMLDFLLWRARIRLRGRGYQERTEGECSADLLFRLDTCWSAATGLTSVNVITGQAFQSRHLLLALESGVPSRVARALSLEVLYAATGGHEGVGRTERVLDEVGTLAARIDQPHALGVADMAGGAARVYRGEFDAARPRLARAESILRTQCTNVAWELSMTRTFQALSLEYSGDYDQLRAVTELALRDAAARDDLHTEIMFRVSYLPRCRLASGDLERAESELEGCRERWPGQLREVTFGYAWLLSQGQIDRYAGRGPEAWQKTESVRRRIQRSLMLTKQPFRIFVAQDEAANALACAHADPGDRDRWIARATKNIRILRREKGARWAHALAALFEGIAEVAQGRHAQAADRLADAEQRFDARDMVVYAAVARRLRGEVEGGEQGRRQVEEADAVLTKHGIRDPARMAATLGGPVSGWSG